MNISCCVPRFHRQLSASCAKYHGEPDGVSTLGRLLPVESPSPEGQLPSWYSAVSYEEIGHCLTHQVAIITTSPFVAHPLFVKCRSVFTPVLFLLLFSPQCCHVQFDQSIL